MALANPRIGYKTIRDAILDLLKANLTVLNTNLSKGYLTSQTIIAGDINVTPTLNTNYPTIMVKLINKDEEWLHLGTAGRKRPEITFRVYGITRDVEGTLDNEIMYLADNIEAVFRDNITISDSVIMAQPTFTDFGFGDFGKGVYVDVVSIDIKCMVEVK